MSKKKLPDHRAPFDDTLVEFSTSQIENLRSDYNFSATYLLDEEIDNVAMFFEKKQYFDAPPKVGEQRKLLSSIVQSANELKVAISLIGQSEILLISKNESDWSRQRTIDDVLRIRSTAEIALTELSMQDRSGRPKRDSERRFIARLIKIYRDGTGERDRYTQDPFSSAYSGKLIEFIEEIARCLKIPIDNRFIGDEVKAQFKRRDNPNS